MKTIRVESKTHIKLIRLKGKLQLQSKTNDLVTMNDVLEFLVENKK